MKLTAQEIFDRLINEDQIKTVKGQIRFHLGDVSIIVREKMSLETSYKNG